ncbi:TPA: hypothetical protein ACXN3R_003647 [Stenotrophomonas maltophilia]|uniref:phage tail tube protein n=1 Tax=Stenotrophomonas maltophilia TaxID=40324 RepID=UPI0013DA44AC|nr:hypothetical protein [Stenotrophomonas maltophilia]MDT3474785.1 hypothetical protein [Stenotrophomonas maltophilia]
MSKTEYFSFQGRVYLGLRNADGSRAPARWVYDGSVLELAMSSTRENKKESWSGVRGVAATMTTERTLGVRLTLGQINTENLALATDGTRLDLASGSAANEAIGAVKPGDVVALEYAAISTLVLEGGTPAAPLVLDTDYTVNLATGIITFLTTKTAVVAKTYQYAAHSVVKVLESSKSEYYALFDAVNSVDGATQRVRADVNRISFPAAESLPLINDTFGEIVLNGEAKIDPVRQSDPRFGLYARVMLVDAA